MAVDLYEKGDLDIAIADGKFKVSVGQPEKIQAVVSVPLGYVLDKIEELIPGDQKAAVAAIKLAVGA